MPVAIVGHVPVAAGTTGPAPDVVIGPVVPPLDAPASFLVVVPELEPDGEPELLPDDEPTVPLDAPLLLVFEPELDPLSASPPSPAESLPLPDPGGVLEEPPQAMAAAPMIAAQIDPCTFVIARSSKREKPRSNEVEVPGTAADLELHPLDCQGCQYGERAILRISGHRWKLPQTSEVASLPTGRFRFEGTRTAPP
jgi:hypothetical protein